MPRVASHMTIITDIANIMIRIRTISGWHYPLMSYSSITQYAAIAFIFAFESANFVTFAASSAALK